MSVAVVIGNGTSRESIDLSLIPSSVTTIGCNALYRDYSPTYLIAVDPGMVQEICQSGYPNEHKFYTRPQHSKKHFICDNTNFLNDSLGWSTGPTALKFASELPNITTIYILGFDFISTTGMVNNVYAGTPNYVPKTNNPIYHNNWLAQASNVITKFQNICYFRVKANDNFKPMQLNKNDNYAEMSIENFHNIRL